MLSNQHGVVVVVVVVLCMIVFVCVFCFALFCFCKREDDNLALECLLLSRIFS